MRMIAAVLGVLLALTSSSSVRADELQVNVASGALSGLASRDGLVRSFKGIPYAAPPVGALRWRPPQPVTAWQGTREANRFGPICPQPSPIPGGFYQREFFQIAEAQSEDCLYLNVWTAASPGADPRPVMVFFHSGGNSLWSGSLAVYDGSQLARKGAVVVTLNFRLGAFGFLTHPELDAESPNHVSGNYGLLDQQAALRWVKANIAAFGGDPERITIFGQSAGASDVGYAMASPLATGLFRRAIIQSSGTFGTVRPIFGLGPTTSLASAEEGGKKLVTELGAPSVAALRDMPSSQITTRVGRNFRAYGLQPVIDGWVLSRDASEAIATGQQNATELLIGSTANEGTELLPPTTPEKLSTTIKQWLGTQAEPVDALYTGTDPGSATAAQDQLMSDYTAAIARVTAGLFARQGHPAWVYSFNRAAPGSDPVQVGAFHCSELVYVFGTQNTVDRPWEEIDRQLSDVMSSYWVRFAATGNPNGPNLPDWPAYDDQSRHVEDFGSRVSVGPGVKAAPLFEAYLSARLSPVKQ
jgi:para-nitrobenzyl esterase